MFFFCLVWQELFLSHNAINILPASINKLTNLELLDISHNHLTRIDQIGFMPHLRILNITGNINLTHLSAQLSTCDSLNDIVLDAKSILYPPPDIIERGTADILKFLLEHNDEPREETVMRITNKSASPIQCVKQTTANMLNVERGCDVVRELNIANEKYSREKVCTNGHSFVVFSLLAANEITNQLCQIMLQKFMEREREELERYSNLEAELHQQQLKRKQDLLQHLLQQQNESDTLIQRMQKEKDSERQKLINDILQGERKCSK